MTVLLLVLFIEGDKIVPDHDREKTKNHFANNSPIPQTMLERKTNLLRNILKWEFNETKTMRTRVLFPSKLLYYLKE